jgi:hypothetical protein
MSPSWMQPDLEGVDPSALAEAVSKLWGHSVGHVDEPTITRLLSQGPTGSTVVKLTKYLRIRTETFSLPDENEMKKQLRSEIARIWIQRRALVPAVKTVLFRVSEQAFGLCPRKASVPADIHLSE